MQKPTATNITDVALSRFGEAADQRFKEILTNALRHLHDFVREDEPEVHAEPGFERRSARFQFFRLPLTLGRDLEPLGMRGGQA